MNAVLRDFVGEMKLPIAFDAPIGHVADNMPLLYGADARLTIDSSGASALTFR